MKTTQSVALAPQKGLRFPGKYPAFVVKMRTFIALFLIVGFFTITVPLPLRAAW
jgi:erythritol transport system permease protein